MINPILDIIDKRKSGKLLGIPSFCCSNKIVIEAILEYCKKTEKLCLIEATSNQVNQYGGYTGMKPDDFRKYTFDIAKNLDIKPSQIIIGGDHLGPLPWANLPAKDAMENAKKLVKMCVLAGYKKIHLDTSMKLGDDNQYGKLSDEIIAERGIILYKECIDTYNEMLIKNPDEIRPVFVVGSEVPVPGGARNSEGSVEITTPADLENTIAAYKKMAEKYKVSDFNKDIIAVVVQPGVEFCDDHIIIYNRDEAVNLCNTLKNYPDIVFEGHSTDYQPPQKLKEMVNDGIAIIKVGPALSFALREGLFALDFMEKELISESEQSKFIEILDNAMLKNDIHWKSYYMNDSKYNQISRKFSFSDRCRYYFICPEVEVAIQKLFSNLDKIKIPLGMLHQFMPIQYEKVMNGELQPKGKELVKDYIINVIDNYYNAVEHNIKCEE